ncbi:hypothetical protein [uncultured Fibrobacter sp.]|uniref:hypothetical protein n=1 Tax=uncultured Fibrobacter sp. TaxID=261512 RepID=UPI002629A98B|nr:hypothetical protein [uncultured Fibrobacter sp.]
MLDANHFSLLPCTKEDISAISARGYFCFPPFDPTKDDDPVSLDSFFCKVVPNEDEEHFSKTYKLIENEFPKDVLALASIANSGFSFGAYEDEFKDAVESMFLDLWQKKICSDRKVAG